MSGLNIVIYESSSTGGNFDYSANLFDQYGKHRDVQFVEWVIPRCSKVSAMKSVHKVLCNDRPKSAVTIVKRLHFLARHFINPFILFFFVVKRSRPSIIFLNDFEQLSAFLWVPLYKIFLRKHKFAIVLHDPDRDAYPPSRSVSGVSMRVIMSLMDFALYHERLPSKCYYQPNGKTRYIKVPHGIYPQKKADELLLKELLSEKGDFRYVAMIGNIRSEKNYDLAIRALVYIKNAKLVIAGAPSSSSEDVMALRALAERSGVYERVVWVIRYLSENEMAAIIESTDLVLLNYKQSFTSQSGILNLIASYRKKIVASRTESSLTAVMERFKLGALVKPGDLEDLIDQISQNLGRKSSGNWDDYLKYASWENHANIVIDNLRKP